MNWIEDRVFLFHAEDGIRGIGVTGVQTCALPISTIASLPQKSIAVLPFLDLTEGMKNEIFADGMTEELIDKLSKIPGLRVPAPRSSFLLKGRSEERRVGKECRSRGCPYE